jgi:transporter family-2 protein
LSRTPLLLATLGVLAGSLLSVQAAINAQLSRGLGHPVLAAVVSFSAGLAALVASAVLLGLAIPSRAAVATVPAYAWFAGGLLGAGYMSANILLTPRLGTAAVMSLAIGGQLLAALLLDHFGVLGLAPRAAGIERLVGAGLLLGGVYLITRY